MAITCMAGASHRLMPMVGLCMEAIRLEDRRLKVESFKNGGYYRGRVVNFSATSVTVFWDQDFPDARTGRGRRVEIIKYD